MRKERLEVADLAVAEYRSVCITDAVRDWIDANHIPYAESCARQILYGNAEEFESFPIDDCVEDGLPKAEVMNGAVAYANLLDLICELKSARLTETHIKHQFFDRWNKFAERQAWEAPFYKTLIEQIRADSNLVAKKLTAQYRVAKISHAARDLSGQKSGDFILIVPGVNRQGQMLASTTCMLRLCESKQKGRKDFITLTHPDPDIVLKIEAQLRVLESSKTFHSAIAVQPFENFTRACETNDRIYIDMPMGEHEDIDEEIRQTWRDHCRTDNVLTHMHGPFTDPLVSTPAWASAQLPQYLSPEDLQSDFAVREQDNLRILAKARDLTRTCANLRLHGLVPSQVFASGEMLFETNPAPEQPS